MTMRVRSLNGRPGRQVLIVHRANASGPLWVREVATVLGTQGLSVFAANTWPDTVQRLEHGGLAAAVLVADDPWLDPLSLLRIIRSIDDVLPCWLITPDCCRQTLQAAASLRVTGVMPYPVQVEELTLALGKLAVN
jgi:hypothetical protein